MKKFLSLSKDKERRPNTLSWINDHFRWYKMSTETLLINLATRHGRWPEHLPSGTWSVRPISSRSLPTRPSSPGVLCLAAFSTCVSSSLVWVPLLSSQVLIHYHCHSNYKDIIIHWFPSTDTHFFQPKISFASTYCRS